MEASATAAVKTTTATAMETAAAAAVRTASAAAVTAASVLSECGICCECKADESSKCDERCAKTECAHNLYLNSNLGAHFRESSLLWKGRRSTSSDSTARHEVARMLNQINGRFLVAPG